MTFDDYRQVGERLMGEADELYVSIDVEGDGPAGYGSLASIGAVAATGEEFYAEVAPQKETYFSECRSFIDSLGMSREYLAKNGRALEEVGRQMRRWADELRERYGKPLVATMFNAGYDWAHIDLMFARAADAHPEAFPRRGIDGQPHCNPFGISPLDSKSLALCLDEKAWSWRATERRHLPDFVVPPVNVTHHALEDARRQLQQCYAMVGYLSARSSR